MDTGIEERVDGLFQIKNSKKKYSSRHVFRWLGGFALGFTAIIMVFFPVFGDRSGLDYIQEVLESSIDKNIESVGAGWQNNTTGIGWELLDNGTVFHMWNNYDDYYFNRSNGIQFSNHYEEYWTQNVLMLGYYAGDSWNLLYRTDELSGFNEQFENNSEYINVTLWKDLSYASYDFRLAIRYHLGKDDNDLTIVPYIKNLGIAIPFQIGFGWEMKDIKIANTTANDYFRLDDNASGGTTYSLHNDSLNESYTNLTYWYTDNETNWTWRPKTIFYLDNWDNQDVTNKTLYLKWNHSLDYKLQVKARQNQYNAPVTLFIRVGTLAVDQEKFTEINWYDADVTYGTISTVSAGYVPATDISVAKIGTDKFVYGFVYNGATGLAVVGTVSGSTISWGSIVTIDADVTVGYVYQYIDVCKVADNKFAYVYADDSLLDDGYVRVCTVSGSTITMGTAKEFETGDVEAPSCCYISDDKFVICYNDETNSDTATAVACTVSGTTVTVGTPVDLNVSRDYRLTQSDCVKIGTDKFIVIFSGADYTDIYGAVGTLSGTTITMGNVEQIFPTTYYPLKVCSPDTDKFVTVFPYLTTAYSVVGTVSGTTITHGAATKIPSGSDVIADPVSITEVDTTHVIISGADGTDGNKGKSALGTVDFSARTISFGSLETFETGSTGGGRADSGLDMCLIDTNQIVIGYQDDDDGDKGKAIIGNFSVGVANNPPTLSGEVPANQSTGISTTPSLHVICTDADSDSMTVTWRSNSSGTWADFATNSTVSTGTNITQTNSNFSAYSTKYWWSINCTDSTDWVNKTYHFTTEAEPSWHVVDNTINGTYTNTTTWTIVTNTVNGSYSNTTIWFTVDSTINGTYTNTSIPTWNIVDNSINGSYTNTTTWVLVDNTINGTYSNTTIDHIVDSTINGTYFNTTTWIIVSNTINGTYTNDTITWNVVSTTINGTYFNTSITPDITISNEYPINNTYDIHLQPHSYVTINHTKGYTMNITFYTNHTGSWAILGTDTNINNGTYNKLFINATTHGTTYYWNVSVNDGTNYHNETYIFTTESNINIIQTPGFEILTFILACLVSIISLKGGEKDYGKKKSKR